MMTVHKNIAISQKANVPRKQPTYCFCTSHSSNTPSNDNQWVDRIIICHHNLEQDWNELIASILKNGWSNEMNHKWAKMTLNFFNTMSLHQKLEYWWHDFRSNDLVFSEAWLWQVNCTVQKVQLHLCGHVERLAAEDPSHEILPCQEPGDWTMLRGCQCGSWLHHVESHLKNMAWLAPHVSGRWLDGGRE